MTYTKPHNVTYTQMAIWIDENSRKADCDVVKLHEYLYHLCYMLARKHNYFNTSELYDRFSLYCANNYLMRLLTSDDENYIEYILKYIKTSLYGWKGRFEKTELTDTPNGVAIIPMENDYYSVDISDCGNQIDVIDFALSLESIDVIIRKYLSKIPYKRHGAEWTNIYMSCLLTLLDSITPTRKQRKLLSSKRASSIARVYNEMKNAPPKLFHLDTSMATYIKVLTNEIRRVVSAELSWKSQSYISTDATMMGVVFKSKDGEYL